MSNSNTAQIAQNVEKLSLDNTNDEWEVVSADTSPPKPNDPEPAPEPEPAVVEVTKTVAEVENTLSNPDSKIQHHIECLVGNAGAFRAHLAEQMETRVVASWTSSHKARILAAALATNTPDVVDTLLAHGTLMGLPEILKAVQLLDAPRQVRQLRAKLERLEARAKQDEKLVKAKTMAVLRTEINNLTKEGHQHEASFSGAKQRRIKKWCQQIPKDSLEFFLLGFPTESWRALADLVHLSPSDFALDFFLPVVFGADAPKDSLVAAAQSITRDNLATVLAEHPRLCSYYSFIRRTLTASPETGSKRSRGQGGQRGGKRRRVGRGGRYNSSSSNSRNSGSGDTVNIPEAAQRILAQHAPLEEVLWFWEEIGQGSSETEQIVKKRLRSGEILSGRAGARTNFGKLTERMLTFRKSNLAFADDLLPYCSRLLGQYRESAHDNVRVAVLGDASSSMDVAIRSATIVASLLAATINADLTFFNGGNLPAPKIPRNAQDCIEVVEKVRASGCTSHAAALWPYYHRKDKVDLFICVTDEEENTESHGHMFLPLFKKFRAEVNPHAQLFFVSFVSVGDPGYMFRQLDKFGLEAKQFRLDPYRPDTSKFDALLGMVSMEADRISQRKTEA